MSRDVFLTKEYSFRLDDGELKKGVSRIGVEVTAENEVGRVIEHTPDGKEHLFGSHRLRSELGEDGWRALLVAIGATS